MRKKQNNSKQTGDVSKQVVSERESELIIAGATKKCPHCGENLPEKIAFCLYCMKPLIDETTQISETTPQGNIGDHLQKTSTKTKILIGVAALLAVAVIVAATSFITASILARHGTNAPDNSDNHTAISGVNNTPDETTEATFAPELTPLPTQIYTPEPTPTPVPPQNHESTPAPNPAPTPTGSGSQAGSRPSNPAISLERAIEIAYADIATRGINASFRSNSGMSWERGQWVWELLFSTQGERMPLIEYYINVDDGSIVKFEWDD